MSKEQKIFGRQNPGDLSIPPGFENKPKQRTLVLNGKAVRIDPSDFDLIYELWPNGVGFSEDDERKELEMTTVPVRGVE